VIVGGEDTNNGGFCPVLQGGDKEKKRMHLALAINFNWGMISISFE
jgi:hypothetical protein